jgi:hypothetical protein
VVEKAVFWFWVRKKKAEVVEKPLNWVVEVARYAAIEVVEKAVPWLFRRKLKAEVVEKAAPWF